MGGRDRFSESVRVSSISRAGMRACDEYGSGCERAGVPMVEPAEVRQGDHFAHLGGLDLALFGAVIVE